jgi:transcriptional regulator with XRE-family HTH domain
MAADWDDSFGALLARLRHAAALTQERLADRAGLSVRAISSLECGSRHPRRLTIDRIAAALELTAEQRAELVRAATHQRRRPAPMGALLDGGPAATPLIGRRAELAELFAHLGGGGPAVLGYDGEAGIGKSRLLAEAVALGTGNATPILVGVARRGGDPYAPLVEALADHVRRTPAALLTAQLRGCAGLDALLPELAGRFAAGREAVPGLVAQGLPPPGGPGRRLMFEAVGRFLDNLAGAGRVVLVLDDLQWAGAEASELLAFLVRRSPGRLRVVIAYRTGEVGAGSPLGQCVAELARLRMVRVHRLAALGAVEADALVCAAAAPVALPAAQRTRILRRSGGLPLFLVELARHGTGDQVPWHLRLAVLHQLAPLPEPVLRLLGRVAAIGGTVPVDRLLRPDAPVELVLDQLDVARRYRVLDETRAGFRFRYPLVREVLAGALGPARRRLWRTVGRPSADVGHAPLRTA